MAGSDKRVYTQEEVNAILSRAIERQRPSDALSLEELKTAAGEAGIAPEEVEAAARELEEERAAKGAAKAARARRLRGFFWNLTSYVVCIGALILVNLMTGGGWWWQWPALGWGIGLAMHLRAVIFPDLARDRRREARRARREGERRRREEERRAREERRRAMKAGARELGEAVERAATTLMAATAKKLHEEVDRAEAKRPPTPGAARARVADERAKTRVAGAEGEALDDEDVAEEERSRRRGR